MKNCIVHVRTYNQTSLATQVRLLKAEVVGSFTREEAEEYCRLIRTQEVVPEVIELSEATALTALDALRRRTGR